MNFRTDTYTAITPFGIVEVDFPEDGGVVFMGSDIAVDHLKAVIGECTGSNGISLTPQNLEPNDFYHFCQPKGSGVTIMRPLDDLFEPEEGSVGLGVMMDDAAGGGYVGSYGWGVDLSWHGWLRLVPDGRGADRRHNQRRWPD